MCCGTDIQTGQDSETTEQGVDGDGDRTGWGCAMRFFEFAPTEAPSPTQAAADAIAQREKRLKRDKAQVAVKAARDKLSKATAKASDTGTI